jgi:hypothetical protein
MTRFIGGFLTVFCLSLLAMGQPLDCRQFRHNEDGSWTPISQLTVTSSPYGGQIYVGPRVFASPDLAKRLNQQCLTKRKILDPNRIRWPLKARTITAVLASSSATGTDCKIAWQSRWPVPARSVCSRGSNPGR